MRLGRAGVLGRRQDDVVEASSVRRDRQGKGRRGGEKQQAAAQGWCFLCERAPPPPEAMATGVTVGAESPGAVKKDLFGDCCGLFSKCGKSTYDLVLPGKQRTVR